MHDMDRAAIETMGIPRLLLMDHAGLAVARAVHELLDGRPDPVLVCAGSGYNGGDGLSAGRHLRGLGHPVRVLLAGDPERLREEPAVYARILERLGGVIEPVRDASEAASRAGRFSECAAIVDALLGIGAQGLVREPAASLIRLMNASGKPVVCADVPSGLHADSGRVQGIAVRAARTVAFGLAKQGCLMAEGPAHAGRLTVDPITIPESLLRR